MHPPSSRPLRRRLDASAWSPPLLRAALFVPAFLALQPVAPAGSKYLDDLQFIDQTVTSSSAALRSKKIDWAGAVKRLRPAFEDCASDLDHVRNVMELLASLQDSHTGVTRSAVGWDGLPGKFDGLFGGGMWFGFDAGKFVLRGVMNGHPEESVLKPGALLVSIDGVPAWLVMARERARIARFAGISSDHSLYGSLSNRLLPFGDAERIQLGLLEPDGELHTVEVGRWGPGGKAFYPSEVQIPAGIEPTKNAMSGFLDVKWKADAASGEGAVAYLRITGGMNAETVAAFHAAMDRVAGATALLLDCRWMGGGSDGSAWEMCGRFFRKGVDNGRHGRIEASGDAPFDGPIVMLQNETMVSSAETFTWAMSETGRAITVGRATGGWGIIPKGFLCPSGLVDFRLGVNDRPTPIRGEHTEGVGWPPDVEIPFGPLLCADADPVRAVGMDILRVLAAGVDVSEARAAFGALFGGDLDRFDKLASAFEERSPGFDATAISRRVRDDLVGELKQELAALGLDDDAAIPDLIGLEARLPALVRRAKAAGLAKMAATLEKRSNAAKKDRAMAEALVAVIASQDGGDGKARSSWLKKYGKTPLGQLVRKRLWP